MLGGSVTGSLMHLCTDSLLHLFRRASQAPHPNTATQKAAFHTDRIRREPRARPRQPSGNTPVHFSGLCLPNRGCFG